MGFRWARMGGGRRLVALPMLLAMIATALLRHEYVGLAISLGVGFLLSCYVVFVRLPRIRENLKATGGGTED